MEFCHPCDLTLTHCRTTPNAGSPWLTRNISESYYLDVDFSTQFSNHPRIMAITRFVAFPQVTTNDLYKMIMKMDTKVG